MMVRMDDDLRRQAVTVLAYLATVAVNGLAVLLPLNGLTTAEISDRFPVLVVPDNYVFGIWSVIYLLLAAFTVYQARPALRDDATLRRLGYLPALSGVLNTAWVVLWHYEVFALTVPVMGLLLATLVLIHQRTADARAAGGARRWLVALPYSVYLGWISVATIANVSQMLYGAGFRGGALPEEAWALAVLAIGAALAAAVLLRTGDRAYGLVIIWAYLGIAVKQQAPIVVAAALLGSALVGVLIGDHIRRGRSTGPGRPASALPTTMLPS
jgi:translocator protein